MTSLYLNPYSIPYSNWYSVLQFGALADGATDDSTSIQSAITRAAGAGGGTVYFPAGTYKIGSTLTIPITANNITLLGYGATLSGAVNGNIIKISDTTTANDYCENICIQGLTISGSGYTDTTYPLQNGIEIDAVLNFCLRDVKVISIPQTGIVGTKSAMSGSTYWNKVSFDNVLVRFCGKQGLLIGSGSAVDDLSLNNCILNHCGEKISSNFADGSSYINAISLFSHGLEVSGNYSISNAGFGYRWGLLIRSANGALISSHYEINGNNQAGSADLLLDTDCDGLAIIGSDHYGNDASAPKYCIQTTSKSNLITNVTFSGGGTHKYDYVIECSNATVTQIGPIADDGGVGVNTALVNPGTNSLVLAAYDENAILGKGQIATNATGGFLYVPTCLGTPTGVPTTKSGYVPVIVDTTNHRWYFYSGGSWRNAGP